MEYVFAYDQQARLDRLRLSPLRSAAVRKPGAADGDWFAAFMDTIENTGRLDYLFADGKPLDLFCCCDQVGTPWGLPLNK